MSNNYYSLGLMSGTSMDGVDASIIQSDGKTLYRAILDEYFKYPKDIYQDLTKLRNKIKSSKDLKKFSKQIKSIEKKITLFHGIAVNKILKKTKVKVDFIGFHGQTIFHSYIEKISKQLGDGKLLSALTKKKVIYDFRQNDLKNNGLGAPLTPIFHKLLCRKFKIKEQTIFINIGGILNETLIVDDEIIEGIDIGPGMCLIDQFIRDHLNKRYDTNGKIAKAGTINEKVLDQLRINLGQFRRLSSFDIKDFNYSLTKGLSLRDGAATLTEFTAEIIKKKIWSMSNIILCGGGRKNKFLVEKLKKQNDYLKLIDDYGVEGDFVESQAFAYIAIRSFLKLPISFPSTTGCKEPCTGGKIVKNF